MGILDGLKKFVDKIIENERSSRDAEKERRTRYSEIARDAEAQGRGFARGQIIEQRRYQRWKEDQRRGNSFEADMQRDIRRIRKNLPR